MREVIVNYPVSRRNFVSSCIRISDSADVSVYDTVDKIKNNLGQDSIVLKDVEKLIPLGSIINLHNADGIRDVSQVEAFVDAINSGIYYPGFFPNIKLVQIGPEEYVVFDGHHSMLAFMFSGRKYLHEIPHIIVNDQSGYISDKEMLVFFGSHSSKINPADWRKYAINWENPEDEQLCMRLQNNMKELFDAIKAMIKIK